MCNHQFEVEKPQNPAKTQSNGTKPDLSILTGPVSHEVPKIIVVIIIVRFGTATFVHLQTGSSLLFLSLPLRFPFLVEDDIDGLGEGTRERKKKRKREKVCE